MPKKNFYNSVIRVLWVKHAAKRRFLFVAMHRCRCKCNCGILEKPFNQQTLRKFHRVLEKFSQFVPAWNVSASFLQLSAVLKKVKRLFLITLDSMV